MPSSASRRGTGASLDGGQGALVAEATGTEMREMLEQVLPRWVDFHNRYVDSAATYLSPSLR